jgi:transposase
MMCLHETVIGPVPALTAQIATATYRRGHAYLRLRDRLGTCYTDADFAILYPKCGQPALPPWRLALVSVLQAVEGLSDRQAAEMVRSRIDWKYLLGLEMTDPGFDFSVLSEFRTRIIAGGAEQQLLDQLLACLKAEGLFAAGGRQRTDSTHVLGAIRVLNRLECVTETVVQALNHLATVVPEWLKAWVPTAWYTCYGQRAEEYRLPKQPAERLALAETIGRDGQTVLAMVDAAGAPRWLRELPAIQTLRQVWEQQYAQGEAGLHWRADADLPPAAALIASPYDREAHYSRKRNTRWVGYKVHLSETCAADAPHVITQVHTTTATVPDSAATSVILADMAARAVLPSQLVLDGGYVDSGQVVEAQQRYGLDLLGPVPLDNSWQTRTAAGFSTGDFSLDWAAQTARCPQGHQSVGWRESHDQHGSAVIRVRFADRDCRACPCRAQCTRATTKPRKLTLRPHAEYLALQQARARQATPEFRDAYRSRAGIEGTLSQGTRAFGLRHAKYRGLAKVHLQHVLTAIAITFVRIAAWLAGTPLGHTKTSAFARLAPAPF